MTRRISKQRIDVDFLVMAYCNGYFPMADSRAGPISWYSPDPRAIIPLDTFKPARSLLRKVRKRIFSIRINTAFQLVIRGCADRDETWISEDIIQAYTQLHLRGLAHSVESWQHGKLVGGLYGVAIGGAFFGESMFSRIPDASKVAFVHLVMRLRERGFFLLDTQFINDHVLQFGAREIARGDYLRLLKEAITVDRSFVGGGDLGC